MAGWRLLFLPDITVPAELPVDMNGFKTQQMRWTKGGIQVARKLLPRVMNPLIRGMVAKAVERDMDLVKAFCEGARGA